MMIEYEQYEKVFRLSSYATAILFPSMFILSVIVDGQWQLGHSFLSDLGVSHNIIAAHLFNWGCIISGSLLLIMAICKFNIETGVDRIASVFLMVGGILLALVGYFIEGYSFHAKIAWAFGLFAGIGMFLSAAVDIKKKFWPIIIFILCAAPTLLPAYFYDVTLLEIILVFAIVIWAPLHVYRHDVIYNGRPNRLSFHRA